MAVTFAASLLLAGVALAPGETRTAAVIDGRSAPLLGADGGRKAITRAIEPSGWQVAPPAASECSTDACRKDAAVRAGVARLFFVDVAAVAGAKFRYDVTLRVWDLEGGVDRRESRTCEPCLLKRDFETTIGALATTLGGEVDAEIARVRAAAVAAAATARESAPPPVIVAAVLPSTREDSGSSRLGPVLLGAGALVAAAGGLLLYLDGRQTDCDPACAGAYKTRGGVPLLVGGVALMAAGTWLWAPWARRGDRVAFLVGPGSAAIRGAF